MAGFDTSNVAATVGANPPNDPFKVLGGLADMQNSLNQNKAFQAKALAGQYLEQATGSDGQPDLGKFSAALQRDPRTAPFAQEALQGVATLRGTGLTNQRTQIGVQADQLGVAGTQVDNARKIIAAAKDPKDAISQLAVGVKNGLVSQTIFNNTVNDPDFANIKYSAALSGAGGPVAQEGVAPTITTVATPQGQQSVTQNRVTGETNLANGTASFIKNKLGPSDLATIIPVQNPDGTKTSHTFGEYFNEDNTLKPGKQLPVIDIGPLSTAAKYAYGQALGPEINNFEKEAAAATGVKSLVDQMLNASDQFSSGPNSTFWQKAGELASEYGVKGYDPNDTKTSAAEKFNKIVPALIRQQAVMLGMNETDTGRQIAASTVPGNGLTKEGIKSISAILKGNADALNAQGQLWKQQKDAHGEGTFGNFRMEFSQKIPPSVFQAQYMSPKEVTELQSRMSPSELKTWKAGKAFLIEHNLLPNAK